ncbi:MAG: FAD:protein FMN transferase [Acidobacteria bacterium]|nr:FAD:protein FMN transferase [Acidobacteriota bacterium]
MKLFLALTLLTASHWPLAISPLAQTQIRFEDSRISMACAYSIVTYGEDESALAEAVTAAFDEVDRIDRLMSHYKPESPLSRLNQNAASQPVKVEPELFDFISECLRYSRESGGAFDITVGPLMKTWGFFRGEGRMPKPEEMAEARAKVGWRHVILNEQDHTIRFDRDGVELDLGGIAKGYAVDKAVEVLKQRGIRRALVNACGSTIYGLGAPPGEAAWEVKLRDPVRSQKTAMTIRLNNRALSVSGSYEKFFDLGGKRYSHIFDPRTGWPVQGVLSVAVLTETGTAGDALDNVFYVSGIETSKTLLKRLPRTTAIFFLPKAKTWKSVELKN